MYAYGKKLKKNVRKKCMQKFKKNVCIWQEIGKKCMQKMYAKIEKKCMHMAKRLTYLRWKKFEKKFMHKFFFKF